MATRRVEFGLRSSNRVSSPLGATSEGIRPSVHGSNVGEGIPSVMTGPRTVSSPVVSDKAVARAAHVPTGTELLHRREVYQPTILRELRDRVGGAPTSVPSVSAREAAQPVQTTLRAYAPVLSRPEPTTTSPLSLSKGVGETKSGYIPRSYAVIPARIPAAILTEDEVR